MSTVAIDEYLSAVEAETRRVAPGEWGLSAPDVGGWPLHVGLRLNHGLLRAQAEVVGPGQVDDHEVLVRNRTLAIVRYAHTHAGAVWVVGDLPERAIDAAELDRLLGVLVAAAGDLRRLVTAQNGQAEAV
ncbi:MAG: hypothetical protein JWP17_2601 [Solirubrobacterales bacterium]|jgi:hypothetical protein|nr:hypothetical protein [Solirubrobacterales bacterium]